MILVTGASGLLGANFVAAARQRYKDIVAVYHQHPIRATGIDFVRGDLREDSTVRELLKSFHPQWVVHCAALTNVDWCEERPQEAWRVNVEMSRNLAVRAKQVGARLVYISTDSVFEGKSGHYSEADAPVPANVYAKSKLAGEEAVQDALESSLIVRTNIYGWSLQEKPSLAEWILNRLESGQVVPGFYDVVFTPILANDLSEFVLDMMDRQLKGLYHVAGSQACSKYDFALQIVDTFGLDRELVQPISVANSALRAPRPGNTSLRTDKVSQVLQRPMPNVKLGLQRLKALRDSGFVTELRSWRGGR